VFDEVFRAHFRAGQGGKAVADEAEQFTMALSHVRAGGKAVVDEVEQFAMALSHVRAARWLLMRSSSSPWRSATFGRATKDEEDEMVLTREPKEEPCIL